MRCHSLGLLPLAPVVGVAAGRVLDVEDLLFDFVPPRNCEGRIVVVEPFELLTQLVELLAVGRGVRYRLPASSVRLCVLSDDAAPPAWNHVVANLKVKVGFYNIADVVRGHLASQNVLASEAEEGRRAGAV